MVVSGLCVVRMGVYATQIGSEAIGMWQRIRMIFRSLFGWMVRGAENPELILRQHMDDLRARLPELNRQVAEVVKLEKMLEMQQERLAQKVTTLDAEVVAAVKLGDSHKEAAKTLIAALEAARQELAETEAQLEQARVNSQRAMQMRDAYEKRIKQQIEEAMRQISRAKRARIEEEMASLMSSFQVGDTTEVVDRMTAQIDERLARAQARTQVAGASVETEIYDAKAAAVEAQTEQKYLEYQRQLGLVPDEETAGAARTMEPIADAETETEQRPAATETEIQES